MNTKHTPGPWEAKQLGADWAVQPVTPFDRLPAFDAFVSPGNAYPGAAQKRVTAANARLMAAAPALLEALELVSAHDGKLTGADWFAITRALKQARGE